MENSLRMGVIHGVGNLRTKIKDQFRGQSIGRNAPAQRFAGEVLNGDVWLAVDFANFINGAAMRMIQGRRGTRLSQDALAGLRVGEIVGRGQLECYVAVQGLVARTKDDTHATSASFF